VKAVLKPNSIIDVKLTDEKKKEAYDSTIENREIISEGTRILSYGDKVTKDKLEVLKELNLIETGKFDYVFAASILEVIMMLGFLLVLYMNFFCKKILYSRHELLLLCVIILLTLIASRIIGFYSTLLIPVFIAPILISILLDLRLGIIVNFFLSIAISFITHGNLSFLYIAIIGGTFSAFLVSKASQRSRLSASGLAIGLLNAAVIVCMGGLSKNTLAIIFNDAGTAALNGVLSTIFTIGLLPFFESTFNIITEICIRM
jgi:membrane-associated HD superfamily phosphohydrolase